MNRRSKLSLTFLVFSFVFLASFAQAAAAVPADGVITVYSTPPAAKVYIDDVYKGYAPYSGPAAPGPHSIKLTLTNFADYNTITYISSGQKTIIGAIMTYLNQTNGTLRVTSTPADAAVYIDNVYVGTTTYATSLAPGTYSIKLTKTGYQDYYTTAYVYAGQGTIIKGVFTTLNGTINQTNGTLGVDAIPNGASVYVNDAYVGKSIYTGTFAPGTYSVKLTKPGYQNYLADTYLATGQTAIIVATLIPVPGSSTTGILRVDAIPNGASVYVNDAYVGKSIYTGTFASGVYPIKLAKPGYQDYHAIVYISAGQGTTIVATLARLNGTNQTNGTLAVSSTPSHASVYIDNTFRGYTTYTGSVSAGPHNLRLAKPGHQDYIAPFAINGGQATSLAFTLNPTGPDLLGYIAYWWGKVNQHQAVGASWSTDPDGISGANLNTLAYCKKWFPLTASVQNIGQQYITGWMTRGNLVSYDNYGTVYECRSGTSNQTNQTGTLNVSSIPSQATVYVDNLPKGYTPLIVTSLSAGSHTLLLTKTGYNNYQTPFTIYAGQTTTIVATLTQNTTNQTQNQTNQTSNLYITSTPYPASIYIDGAYYGTTPNNLHLSPGTHTLLLTRPLYNDYTTTFSITAGETVAISAVLIHL